MQPEYKNSKEGPLEEVELAKVKMFLQTPYYNLIIKNKERVLGELASLKDSPLFQYLRVVREMHVRDLILNDKEGPNEKADLHRGGIKVLDEILGMSETIKNAERYEKENRHIFEQIQKEIV